MMQVAGQVIAVFTDRHPEIGRRGQPKFSREHTYQGEASPIQGEPTSDHGWVSAKMALPQAVADQNHRRTSGFVFFGTKCASSNRTDTQQRKQPGRRQTRLEALGLTVTRQIKSGWRIHIGRHLRKTACLALK